MLPSTLFRSLVYVLALTLSIPTTGAESQHSHGKSTAALSPTKKVPLYKNLGEHHYPVTAASPIVQRYFDQGLRLYYAFNHQEATRAFEEAARRDPQCAMCYWGVALSLGPNINAPLEKPAALAAYAAIQRALALKSHASTKEHALINALAARYAATPTDDRSAHDQAYARAMHEVTRRYPNDLEAATLYAESLMDLSPWNYWTREGTPRPATSEILAQLERVMAASPNHPGANHFYIHAVEAVDPQRAVSSAERLAKLMPGAGHLVHMPGHIYVRVGRYEDAIKANEHAVHADESFIRDQNPAFGIYVAGYYPHNYDFLAFAASMIGRSAQSITAAEKMATLAPAEVLREPGMTFVQHHQTRHLQLKVRFGRWNDIVEAPQPPADLPHARAMWHYAQGRATAAMGKPKKAAEHLARLTDIARDPQLASQRLEFNTSGAVLSIAAKVLSGHVALAEKNYPRAVSELREAARLEDAMTYGEPPEWSVPVRQELGVALLEARLPEQAEKVFREDLRRFPENGWSLHGLARALRAQNRGADANAVAKQFAKIWATADVPLKASGS